MAATQQPAETKVTSEHQLDALASLLDQLGWEEGTRVKLNIIDKNTVVLLRLPANTPPPEGWPTYFAGKLGDVFGDHDEIMAYLEEERQSWEPEEPHEPR